MTLEGVDAVVDGSGGVIAAADVVLDAALAGTTSRFVTALAALAAGPVTIDGAPPLRRRPMGPLHDALASLGVTVEPGETVGGLPVTVTRSADASAVERRHRGDVSSQYLTALMLIAPLLDRRPPAASSRHRSSRRPTSS